MCNDIAMGVVMVKRKIDYSQYVHDVIKIKKINQHIILCQSDTICQYRKNILLEINVWLSSVHTVPDMQDFLVKGLHLYLSNQP